MCVSLATHLCLGIAIFSCINAQFPQKCYYAPNKLAGSAIIPCGDPVSGVIPCCQNGDTCMSDSVCYNQATGVTYQYGCTDSSYAKCPKKCDLDVGKYLKHLHKAKEADVNRVEKSNWVGLVYCNGSSGNQWACNHPETCGEHCPTNSIWQQAIQTLPARPPGCDNLIPQKYAFAGPTSLAPIMLLPTNLGGATTYYSLTAISGTTVTYSATTPYATNANHQSSGQVSSESGLSTAAKTGIGAGIGGAALVTTALAAFILLKRRRRSKRQQSVATAPGSTFGQQAVNENQWSPKAELASDAQTQRFTMPPQELPTNKSDQDLSLVGQGGKGSGSTGLYELPTPI
ncbi:hypothetical protein BLS_004338 [Venturia inaequalis]|uniref:Uncharacterized protein n=1 Tax=Venturia inaequalis TaxID=5025 RepID=A0A8H3ULM9_VENIN|nr:hypothetical protein BLS_004338 [Venturia inaequalis]